MSIEQPLKVGIVGLGTVGVGTIQKIESYNEHAAEHGLRSIEITHVSARSQSKDREVDLSSYSWVNTPTEMATVDVDVVVELIGNQGPDAQNLIKEALLNGKHVVTANKDLMASPEGLELAKIAENKGVNLRMEAAVLGGNQVVNALCRGHLSNEFTSISGIMNGTTNYMIGLIEDGMSYEAALKDAQDKGYAETDPTSDVEGYDAFYKKNIMTAIAQRVKPRPDRPETIGISKIAPVDIAYAEETNRKIKHLATMNIQDGTIMQTVSPWMLKADNPLSAIGEATNAVTFKDANGIETYTFVGPGAGPETTATSVIADIAAIARGENLPTFGTSASKLPDAEWGEISDLSDEFYLRVNVQSSHGNAAKQVIGALNEYGISEQGVLAPMDAFDENGFTAVALTTENVRYGAIKSAVEKVERLPAVHGEVCIMRLEA